MIALLVLITALAQPAASPAPAVGAADVLAVNTVLQANPQLLNLHRGYSAYLDQHPNLAKLEDAYATLCETPGFGPVAQAFNETLGQNPAAQRDYDTYAAFLAINRAARSLISGLNQVEAQQPPGPGGGGLSPALGYLRANPNRATSLLQNPNAIASAPNALQPLLTRIQENAALRNQLLQRYQGIQQTPGAQQNIYPWWQRLAGAGNPTAYYARALERYFAQNPQSAQIWNRRTDFLAAQPAVREWLRYWHGRIQRQPVLANHYWRYLEYLKAHPKEKKAITKQWRQSYGPPPTWPPPETPPPLPPMRVTANVRTPAAILRAALPQIQIHRPVVPRPIPPQRPVVRAAPVK